MRRLISIAILLCLFVSGSAFTPTEAAEWEGYVMPLVCEKRDPDAGPNHTTECALKPDCVRGGFGLWTVDKITKFDARGNELALKYFQHTERTDHHKVRVIADLEDGVLKVEELIPIE